MVSPDFVHNSMQAIAYKTSSHDRLPHLAKESSPGGSALARPDSLGVLLENRDRLLMGVWLSALGFCKLGLPPGSADPLGSSSFSLCRPACKLECMPFGTGIDCEGPKTSAAAGDSGKCMRSSVLAGDLAAPPLLGTCDARGRCAEADVWL